MAAPASTPQHLLGADDRRAARKAVVDSGLVTVEMCPAGFGLMVNVSERGIAVYTMKNLVPSQDVQVSFMLPGSPRRIECNGQVRWAADSHAGLKLKGFDPQSLAAFRRWIGMLPETPLGENPKLQRRTFPQRDQQIKAIQAHLADHRLELDDALQFIIERLLTLTASSGGAIALGEPGQMVCRASAGVAPEVGVQIPFASGVTGECIRTGKEIYCEDTELDPRVDREACRELNLRSSLVVPVLHRDKVAGVLEAFSSVPAAFQEDHRWLVKRLAEVTASIAYDPSPAQTFASPLATEPVTRSKADGLETIEEVASLSVSEPAESPVAAILRQQAAQRSLMKQVKPFWPLGVFAGSIVLLLFAWHQSKPAETVVAHPPAVAAASPVTPTIPATKPTEAPPSASGTHDHEPKRRVSAPESPQPEVVSTVPQEQAVIALPRGTGSPDSLSQLETAPAIQVASATALPSIGVPATTSTPELLRTSALTGGAILRQVQPIYPPLALQFDRQGDVVLRAHVNKRGKVTKVKLISGDPILAGAGEAAVREWRYQPFLRDNVPQEIDTTITLRFRTKQR